MVKQVQQQVIPVNLENLEDTKRRIKQAGPDKFHVVSDFDRTITCGLTSNGGRTPTVISQLRADPKYLGEEYAKEANRLFYIYGPKEIDPNLSLEQKRKEMHDWWRLHFELIARGGFTKSLAERVVKERPLKFREGVRDFLEFLRNRKIPVTFISTSPGDITLEYLRHEGLNYENVYVVSNRYSFDDNGRAINVREPIIHTFNKSEVSLKDSSVYGVIKSRPNVLLMGDSKGDSRMAEGFHYKNLIKIGFLNEKKLTKMNVEKLLKELIELIGK